MAKQPIRRVVFDIETKQATWDGDLTKLELALVGIWDSETDQYAAYTEAELPILWRILEKTDILIGFNSDYFDIPILNRYYTGDLTKIKSLDLLREVKISSGKRLGLNALAKGTLGRGKSGDGLMAVEWWAQGEIEKVKEYCIDDVRLTKELWEYALANKHVKYRDFTGEVRQIPLDTGDWDKPLDASMTHTLPF